MLAAAKSIAQPSQGAPKSVSIPQVLRASVQPEVTVNELVGICQNDPAFVVRLLARVNCGRYALRSKVNSVQQGVSLLGVRGIRNLALAAAVADIAPNNPAGNQMLALCLRRAIASRLIAERLEKAAVDDFFTVGMLIEVGVLSRVQDDWNCAVKLARAPAAMRVTLERESGYLDHAACGGELTRAWGLDAEFSSAIAQHHAEQPPDGEVARVVWLAERIAGVVEGGNISACRNDAIEAAKHLQLTSADIDVILKRLPALMRESKLELDRSVDPQPDSEPTRPDTNTASVGIDCRCAVLALELEAALKDRERLAEELRVANEQLSSMAMTDPLTGLPNRRAFEQCLARDLARAERHGGAVTLVLIDADQFKKVNASYGYQGGDSVLCALAQVLRESTRTSDVATRMDGEEFALILPQTDADSALVVAERVRVKFAVRKITLPDGRTAKATVSVGVATVQARGCRGMDNALYEAADRALKVAKSVGGNCVHTAPDTLGG